MDWANERWVRVFTRDTVSWKLCDWRAHTTLLHLFRKVDRAGVLDVGDDGIAGLAAVLELPIEVVEPGIEQLTRTGNGRLPTVVFSGAAYVIPNFIEAQETPQSDPQRTRESRGRRRDLASLVSRNVSDVTRNVSEPSRGVTSGHAVSRADTPDQTNQTNQTNQTKPGQTKQCAVSGEPDHATLLAQTAVSEINRLASRNYKAESEAVSKLCRALARAKRTPEQVIAVIASKRAWIGDPKMGQFFRPQTLLAAENFAAYLDDLEAGPLFTRSQNEMRMPSADDDEPDLTYAGFGMGAEA